MGVIIAGCGKVGSQLALLFSHEGHDGVVIDRDHHSFQGLGFGISLQRFDYNGDDLRLGCVVESGDRIEKTDAFVALANYDDTDLLAPGVTKGIYGVKRVVSRLNNLDKENTYQALDIDSN